MITETIYSPSELHHGKCLCESCLYCTHSPNLFQPYWWCSYRGREIKKQIKKCEDKRPR